MATYGASSEDGGLQGLQGLLEASPDSDVHTSAAAEASFVVGLFALLAAPFSVMLAVSLAGGILAIGFGFVGMATTSRPHVAGRVLVPLGLLCGLAVVAVVGLRYLGVDTAFGDGALPTLRGWMDDLNSQVPLP